MPESMLLAAAAGVIAGALAVGVVLLLRRIVVSSKELGTDVERATYQTLHLASQAASTFAAASTGTTRSAPDATCGRCSPARPSRSSIARAP